jgi:hypothetical protein
MVSGQEIVFCWVPVPWLINHGEKMPHLCVNCKSSNYLPSSSCLIFLLMYLTMHLCIGPTSYRVGYQGETRY